MKLSDINLSSKKEQEQLLNDLDKTSVAFPINKTVVDLFHDQVKRIPDNIAIKFEDQVVTYLELDRRASKLASLLRKEGVMKDTLVGLLADRRIETVIGILAVLKSGGAYVPIDTDYPQERMDFLIQDSGVKILLTTEHQIGHLPTGVRYIPIHAAEKNSSLEPVIGNSIKPSDLCYVIYTSGTTGNPKGVMVEHRNVVRLFFNDSFQFQFGEDDVWTMFHSHCFDFSVWEIFGALLFGGELIIIPKAVARDPKAFLDIMVNERVTVLNQTPSAFYNLIERELSQADSIPNSLKYVIFGGEALTPGRLKDWKNRHPEVKMVNMFGITETTVHVTYKEIGSFEIENNLSNVGKPIPTLSVYILDEQHKWVPKGVVGELYVGGSGVSRGYLGNKKLTDQKFVSNPFKENEKLYRTGDLARIIDTGDIEYIGRMDHQVQLRGFRIELEEIQHNLESHQQISSSVVLIMENEANKFLVAYYVSDTELETSTLRAYLLEKIPDYMVPSYFVHLTELPLTSNGKLNRDALPDPELKTTQNYLAPRTKKEVLLAGIWSQVLGFQDIGVTDDFFSLGGDSIKSIQISSRVRGEGYELSVKDIFTVPTVREQSLKLKPLARTSEQAIITGPVPLAPIQRWFFDGPIESKHHFNQSVLLHFSEEISTDFLRRILTKLQEHHDVLRMVFRKEGDEIHQENLDTGLQVSLEEYDLIAGPESEDSFLKIADTLQSGINLEEGPLMKTALFHFGTYSRLLVVMHHLITDGVSWRIFLDDLATLYRQITEDTPFTLPLKTDSYKSWAQNLKGYTKKPYFLQALQYWKNRLSEKGEAIPKDNPDGQCSLEHFDTSSFQLEEQLTKRLLTQANLSFNTQISDLLLTALWVTVKKQYDIEKLWIDIESHGRHDLYDGENVTRTMGWFTTIYPVLLKGEAGSFEKIIKDIKESLRNIPNDGIDVFVSNYLGAGKSLPLYDKSRISFNYLGELYNDDTAYPFRLLEVNRGHEVAQHGPWFYDWDIVGMITGGKLKIDVRYSKDQYEKRSMNRFVDLYKQSLYEIIDYCCDRPKSILTPSDITYTSLSIGQLDALQEIYDVQDVYPLTPMQESMLYNTLKEPEAEHYLIQVAYEITGQPDIKNIHKSANQLIDRYDVLRTVFLYDLYERPLQVVLKQRKIDFQFYDIQKECDFTTETELVNTYCIKERSRKFDASKDVLIRLIVLQTAQDRFLFIWNYHHILMDGWCMGTILKDFEKIYAQNESKELITLHKVRPYSSYIKWLEQRDHSESLSYWKNYLASYSGLATLPFKKRASERLPYTYESHTLLLNTAQTEVLHKICNDHRVTVNAALQCAWGILLARYNNIHDVVFGTVMSGRPAEIEGVEEMVGLFINTVPVRINYEEDTTVKGLLKNIQKNTLETEHYQYASLSEIQAQSDLGAGLLDHIMIVENYPLSGQLEDGGQDHSKKGYVIDNIEVKEQNSYDLTLFVLPGNKLEIRFDYNSNVYDKTKIERVAAHFWNVINSIHHKSGQKVSEIEIIGDEEKQELLYSFNDTYVDYQREETIVSLFEKQVHSTPEKVAVRYENNELSYKELNQRSDHLASYLKERYGIGVGSYVAIMMERSEAMLTGMLGIMKAGAAYIPIDPTYPTKRIEYILKDSGAQVLLLGDSLETVTSSYKGEIVRFDGSIIDVSDHNNRNSIVTSEDLCYLIYTSGSTGNPKGVMISHASVVNFFAGMDQHFEIDEDDSLLALTSTSFDISVLELFWTLCRGAQVVIHPTDTTPGGLNRYVAHKSAQMDFGLFFFSSYNNSGERKYDLLLESVKYADRQGFRSVWTPERHFHEFGGLFPNPSVTSAALATVTKQIELRSGSIVAPLHDPIRVAEEWSVVDNLSKGRVGLSFASGWNPNDFVLSRDEYEDRHRIMYEDIETIKNLWEGGSIKRDNALHQEVEVKIFPAPIQTKLPVWVTAAGNEETFRHAGQIGANLLTHLLGQDIETLSEKIKIYRTARKKAGYDSGKVALMLHTYIGDSLEEVERAVEEPFKEYLKSSINLSKVIFNEGGLKEEELSPEMKEEVLTNAFKRYYKTSSLIGTKSSCMSIVHRALAIGVDEIACLIDFGVEEGKVLDNLKNLRDLKQVFNGEQQSPGKPISMMQSTPSLLKLLKNDEGSDKLLNSLRLLLVGGEPITASLVSDLQKETKADIYNMYGPTETTIWSTTGKFSDNVDKVTVGGPIANTQIYILGKDLQLLPLGVEGDLYIGGEGLSKGYWKQPALTEERFIDHPFSSKGKIYKTGDKAKWLEDGNIQLIGRDDHQVKIRGFRIELGEIEANLLSHKLVSEAVVLAKETADEKRLVAYVVLKENVDADQLRGYLSGKLPHYMVPAYYMKLDSFPLTPNKKIDRRALPDPGLSSEGEFVPPSNKTEQKLVEIWGETLEIPAAQISIIKTFFELGGHSLKIATLKNKIRQHFNIDMPLNEVFNWSTVERMADYLTTVGQLEEDSDKDSKIVEIIL
ncbi:MAG: amino acid adenylation domain-containing protein [Fulvivirga sp.]